LANGGSASPEGDARIIAEGAEYQAAKPHTCQRVEKNAFHLVQPIFCNVRHR
jgi:hypothetical protein